jgi:hypothetical protein
MELKPRQEWTSVHEFQSAANAQPLDGGLIANAASASLKVRYTPNGATATLRCSEQDTELAQQIEALGWTPRPSGFKRLLPRASASVPAQLDWTPLTSNNAVADTQPEAPAQDSAPTPPTSSPLLAAPGEQGFLLGVATDGSAVQLTWESHRIGLVAPADRTRTAVLALVRRALESGMAAIVIASREVLRDQALMPVQSRFRILDSLDLWQSASIPWREIDRELFRQALNESELELSHNTQFPEQFGAFLAQYGVPALQTEAVLGLTALPGDDLRGVIAAGGGVALIDDGDAGSKLLIDLLLAYLAVEGTRPVLLIRPPNTGVPPALAKRALQVALGVEANLPALLTSIIMPGTEGWHLSFAGAAKPIELLPDLSATPLNADSDFHGRIISGIADPDAAEEADLDGWYEQQVEVEPIGDESLEEVDFDALYEEQTEVEPIIAEAIGDESLEEADFDALYEEQAEVEPIIAEAIGDESLDEADFDALYEEQAEVETISTEPIEEATVSYRVPVYRAGLRRKGFVMRRGGLEGGVRREEVADSVPVNFDFANEMPHPDAEETLPIQVSQQELSDAQLLAAFQAGVNLIELTRRLHEAYPEIGRSEHRARLKALISGERPTPAPIAMPIEVQEVEVVASPEPEISADLPETEFNALEPVAAFDLSGLFGEDPLLSEESASVPEGIAYWEPDEEVEAADPEGQAAEQETEPELFLEHRVWKAWDDGEPLGDIIKIVAGQEGLSAAKARERVFQIVFPMIVDGIGASALVSRLKDGKKPLKSQTLLYETLLRKMARQERPVSGASRTKIHAQIVELSARGA